MNEAKKCPHCGRELDDVRVYEGHGSAWNAEHCTRLRTATALERIAEGVTSADPDTSQEIEIPVSAVNAFLGGAFASSAAARGQEIGANMAAGAKREREKIVAWLQAGAGLDTPPGAGYARAFGEAIAAGQYEKKP